MTNYNKKYSKKYIEDIENLQDFIYISSISPSRKGKDIKELNRAKVRLHDLTAGL